MRSCEPASSSGTVVPSAVAGLLLSRSPTAPSKCTSPPKAKVTGVPLPFQFGFSGEWAGNDVCDEVVAASWCAGGRGALGPSAGEEGKVDEEGKQEDADRCKLTTPASDPARDHAGTMSHATWRAEAQAQAEGRAEGQAAGQPAGQAEGESEASGGGGERGVPPRCQRVDEPAAAVGDQGQAVVEPGVVAVVGVRHVGGRAGGGVGGGVGGAIERGFDRGVDRGFDRGVERGVERAEELEAGRVDTEAVQRPLVATVKGHDEVDVGQLSRRDLVGDVRMVGVVGPP